MNDTNVYAVIVTYNGMQWIDKSISSLINSSISVNIIVVDNCSTDNTVNYIKEKFSQVEIIENKNNLGFGKGNNVGIRIALEREAEYVFLLNQDAWVEVNTIHELIKSQRANLDYGIVSPIHMDGEGTGLQYNFAGYINMDDCPRLVSDLFMHSYKPIYEIKFVNAAAWLITKECIQKAGIFDELTFSHYGEDEDYVIRASFYSFKTGVVPSAKIYHDNKGLTWELVKNNLAFRTVHQIIGLKNIKSTFRSNLLLFLKKSIENITSAILFRKWKDLMVYIHIMLKTIHKIPVILKARKISYKQGAFLESK